MKTGVHDLEQGLRDAQGWVRSVALRLNTRDGNLALHSLKATLHALRDQLDDASLVRFGSDLPALLRGLYYDGWDPAAAPHQAGSLEDFTQRIDRESRRVPRIKAERAAKAALEVIFERLPAAAMAPIVERLPVDLRELWPDEPPPYTDLRTTRPLPDPEATRRSRASPRRLRHATARGPGETVRNALPERKRPKKVRLQKRRHPLH
jgi:uncharacterized protein (DUF2267 family)